MDKSPLAIFRQSAGLSLEQFGQMLVPPVDKSTVLRWERGTVRLPFGRLDEVERVTGISRQQLRPDIFDAGHSSNDGGRAAEAAPCATPPASGAANLSPTGATPPCAATAGAQQVARPAPAEQEVAP